MARSLSPLWSLALSLVLAAPVVNAQTAAEPAPATSFEYGRFGAIPVIPPAGEASEVVLLLSGDQGSGPREAEIAAELASDGAAVLQIDTARYLAAFSTGKGRTIDPSGDFEGLSQFGQMQIGVAVYHPPILIGVGAGATLAYAALAEAPRDTFAGAAGLDFCPLFQGARTLYHGDGLRWDKTWTGAGWRLLPDRKLPKPWIEIETPSPAPCAAAWEPELAATLPNGAHLALPADLPPEAQQGAWKAQLRQALKLIAAKRQEEAASGRSHALADLPLFEVPANAPEADVLAIDISGSGGWQGLDVALGKALAERGVPTVGVSSLDYFWRRRDPDGAAVDLARILDHFLTEWHTSAALVLGYSQGADVVPFMVTRLPSALRSRVAVVGLIGPDAEAEFDLGRGAFMHRRHVDKPLLVASEIPRLRGPRLVCFYGKREPAPLCPSLGPKPPADVVLLPGGHGFRGDAPLIADHLLAAAGKGPPPTAQPAARARRPRAPKRAPRPRAASWRRL
jgi:type IV secretory pathway VirJ component